MTSADGQGGAQTQVSVALLSLPPLSALEAEWRELESRSAGSFFTSWSWIGCWINLLGDVSDLRLLRACSGGRTVGLGILGLRLVRRNGVIFSRMLRLHSTGRPEIDLLAIECNGFLVERGHEESVSARMVSHLAEAERGWDELVLDGLPGTPGWPHGHRKIRVRVKSYANHSVNLQAVREKAGGYLPLLGSKTRARIRRSCKEYEAFGPLSLQPAQDAGQALQFLEGLKVLHQAYWVGRGEPGAFANPFFDRFHRHLVEQAFARGEIQLLAIDAGPRRLGYIYNFVYQDRIYNYQTGLDYEICEKHNRPGLVAHMYAVEFNAARGHAVYDFLAGDHEYKQALGTDVAMMSWLILQRDRLRFRLEAVARGVRNGMRPGGAGAAEVPADSTSQESPEAS